MVIGREIDSRPAGEQERKPLTAQQVNLLQFENSQLKARNAALESAIRGLVVDGYDKDGPYTRDCAACAACDIPYDFRHEEGCPAKPALDFVFGPNDADHVKGGG